MCLSMALLNHSRRTKPHFLISLLPDLVLRSMPPRPSSSPPATLNPKLSPLSICTATSLDQVIPKSNLSDICRSFSAQISGSHPAWTIFITAVRMSFYHINYISSLSCLKPSSHFPGTKIKSTGLTGWEVLWVLCDLAQAHASDFIA